MLSLSGVSAAKYVVPTSASLIPQCVYREYGAALGEGERGDWLLEAMLAEVHADSSPMAASTVSRLIQRLFRRRRMRPPPVEQTLRGCRYVVQIDTT